MRHGMLMTAVATVTLPGLLALLAVVGHEHVAGAEAGATAAALDGTLNGPSPVAPATAGTAVPGNGASVQRESGAPVAVLSRVTISQQVTGMSLLNSAADAGLSTSYQGTELISQSGVDGSVKTISQVWHQGGGQTLVETVSGATSTTTQPPSRLRSEVASSDPATGSPEGVFGVTRSLMALLGKHYVPVYLGGGAVAGRAATVVELYRFDGSLAARYWLDKQTFVPLRRDLFDDADHVISQDKFVQVKFGAPALPKLQAARRDRRRHRPRRRPPGSRPASRPGSSTRSPERAGRYSAACRETCPCTRPRRPRPRAARSSTLSTPMGSTSSRSSCSGAPCRRKCPAGSR